MNLKKTDIEVMDHCYAVSVMNLNSAPHVLFATEGHGPCYMYSCKTGEKTVVWEQPGGTMGLVQIPGKDEFLAVQKFFPTFQSEEACVVWGIYDGEKWEIKKILDLPYLHRFDILTNENGSYFIGCTLCTSKKEKDDWSDPGKVYAAKLPDDLNQPMKLEILWENMTKNHGYWRGTDGDGDCGYVGCEEGIFRFTPPDRENGSWKIEKLLDAPCSDMAVYDLDGDGLEELVTIEPFHGEDMVIRHLNGDTYEEVYRYPKKFEFGHVVWAGMFAGTPTVIGGYRKMDKRMYMIRYRDGQYMEETLDSDTGPSNIAVWNAEDKDVIFAANRQIGVAAAYTYHKK